MERNGKTYQANGLKEKQQKFGNNLSHIRNERGVYVETLLPNPEETAQCFMGWLSDFKYCSNFSSLQLLGQPKGGDF